jgi:hypothetical protein
MQESIEKIRINDVDHVRADSMPQTPQLDGKYVIVRCRNAGVHAGYLVSRENGVVQLANSRRLWRWWSKFTLSGLAMDGVLKGKESECKFACVVQKLDLTESDVCEVIYCTSNARESIQAMNEYSNE